MNERRLRGLSGLFLVVAHFLLLVLVAIFAATDRFTTDELFTAFGIIGPLFAAYTTASVRSLLRLPPQETPQLVAWERAVLVLTIPLFFFVALVAIICWKAFGSLTFDAFVKLVGVAETFVGIYVGMVVEHLFGAFESETHDQR